GRGDIRSSVVLITKAENLSSKKSFQSPVPIPRETLINGPTSEVAGEMASNFLDDEANRRSIQ
ncbi:hypothetical protein ACKI6Z_12630, partial [Staphylococcus epidermidis]